MRGADTYSKKTFLRYAVTCNGAPEYRFLPVLPPHLGLLDKRRTQPAPGANRAEKTNQRTRCAASPTHAELAAPSAALAVAPRRTTTPRRRTMQPAARTGRVRIVSCSLGPFCRNVCPARPGLFRGDPQKNPRNPAMIPQGPSVSLLDPTTYGRRSYALAPVALVHAKVVRFFVLPVPVACLLVCRKLLRQKSQLGEHLVGARGIQI